MSKRNELLQACNEQGEPLVNHGITHDEIGSGALHAAAHLWIWREVGQSVEILVQKRAASKITWPNFFDISAAGHVDFLEKPLAAAIRETKEELGLDLKPVDLRLLFVHRQYIVDSSSGRIENEIQYIYGFILREKKEMMFADGEVELVQWLQLEDFLKLTRGLNEEVRIVPHGDTYFAELEKEIRRLSL